MTRGSYVAAGRDYERDTEYVTTRITRDGRDGYPVEPGRYRLIAARACPWASRAIIVRRLLGLESAISMGLCGPTHDERSWTFDLDPDGVDPVLGYERVQQAYLARFPDYSRGITVPAMVEIATRQLVTNDFAQITLDFSPSGPTTTGPARRTSIRSRSGTRSTRWPRSSTPTSTTASTSAASPALRSAYEHAYDRLFSRLDWLSERLARRRYLVGDTITEADVRLFTTLARFDAVYHSHFKCNRHKLTELPVLWAYARDLFQTPGFGDTVDFAQIKRHYYVVHTDLNPTQIVPTGPDLERLADPARPRAAGRSAVRRRHAARPAACRRDRADPHSSAGAA